MLVELGRVVGFACSSYVRWDSASHNIVSISKVQSNFGGAAFDDKISYQMCYFFQIPELFIFGSA